MRRLPLLLTTLVLAAPAPAGDDDAVKDPKSGLVVQMPEQWSRETQREKGSIKFSAIYDLTPTKYVLFNVETGPSTGFSEETWLAGEKAAVSKFLKSTDIAWTTEPVTVGGVRAVRYTVGGKANTDKGYDLRVRGCGFVQNDVFFRIQELSYNKAHEEAADALKAIWDAVRFEEANPFAEEKKEEGCGEGEEKKPENEDGAKEGGGEAPKGEPTVIEDKAGNLKVSIPPGWALDRAPQDDEGEGLRLFVRRELNGGDIGFLEVYRIRILHADFFEQNEAGDAVEKVLNDDIKIFERFFEEGSSKVIRPTIDARARLADADKSCGFEVRGLPLSEDAKIEEAKKLIARGDTSVKVPEFKEMVVRGRLAMLSPYIYVTIAWTPRSLSEDERILAEIAQIQDSFEFETAERAPPPLESDTGPFGNTTADAANATERKGSKTQEFKKGAKVAAAIQFDYILPPGFQDAEKVKDPNGGIAAIGDTWAVQVVAQDGNNGWVWIKVLARSSKELGSNQSFEDKKKVFETWISNFESQARGAGRMPKKPEKVKVGNLDGDGCELEGKITGFHATEVNMVTDKSGWRIQFELKTRGSGAKTFADGIKTFLKRFKATKK